ncbi:SET domain-containing protein 5 [Cytospora mali]|uniref:SET domain-containing protein 5 n=1 Tax=Cytospora mali TaxID=578113 RepID=A0A194W282_CYTMA|nr:SET domain-containing protein 5 [Valsa mali]
MYTQKEAKEVSIWTGGYCAVTNWEVGRKGADSDCPQGIALQGYRKGVPVYYVTAGMDKKIKDEETKTIIGPRIIQRPIDTCLGTGWNREDGTPPPNRTFTNELVVVSKSPLRGYGIFAAVDIKKHTHILVEKPLFSINGWTQVKSEYSRLNEEEKAIFDGLVGYHRVYKDPVLQKYSANHFALVGGHQGILAIASNFNHACHSRRNTQYTWDSRRQVMTFTVMKNIKKGQEILISYADHRSTLYALYGFVCHCGGCENQAHEDDAYTQ